MITRKLILILLAVLPLVGIALYLSLNKTQPVYSATDDSLDLAIADGIKQASNEQSAKADPRVRAVIVPHHLVAAKAIALGVKALDPSTKKVVIISPDHFFRCAKMLCTTYGKFKTFFGELPVSTNGVDALIKNGDFVDQSSLFREEHGIYAVLPFIRYYLPNAEIIPIVVSQKSVGDTDLRSKILNLIEKLLSDKDTALIISSDFSHYLPLAESDSIDHKTIKSFCSGSSQEILKLNNPSQSDCPLCLWLSMEAAKDGGFWNPELIWHSNSANLLHDTSATSTTSHLTFLLTTDNSSGSCHDSAKSEAKILFVGDMSFDRWIRQVSDKKGSDFIFSCIDPLLKNADFAIGNLEGPITNNPSISEKSVIGSPANYILTFPTTTAELLARHNFRAVNIGNNHIGTFGSEGLVSTHDYLNKANVGFFGGLIGDETIYRTEVNGIKLSFVSYNEFGGSNPEIVANSISKEKSAGRTVIVYAHWGDEYSEIITRIQNVAKIFANSGADVIIGSHPHIVLPHEYINNTLVYYSLGNFIFDQYFNDRVSQGLAVILKISSDKIIAEEHPVKLKLSGQTCPIN